MKNIKFYFILSFLQNTHISLSILQYISIKYSFFLIFLLFLSNTFYLYTLSLSPYSFFLKRSPLSLSLSLSLKNYQPKSLLHWVLSSLANPRTKLHKHRSISVGLSVWVCLRVGVFLCWFVCVNVFVCRCVCVHLRKRRWGVDVVVHGEEREKLVRTEINKIINTHATVTV